MQDIPYIPYDEGGWKKRFEITIPILLLILVLFVLAWKLGWLMGIPFLGDFLGGEKVANILIVGQDNNIATTLDQVRTGVSVNYEILDSTEIENIRDPDYLKTYNIIILTESIDPDNPTYIPAVFRSYVKEYLAGNGKLILFGVAASRDPVEPSTNVWEGILDAYVPVSCKTGLCDATNSMDEAAYDMVSLKLDNINHPVLREFSPGPATFTTGQTIEYALVNADRGTKIATIEVEAGTATLAYPGIVEKSYGLGGKSYYFAYHPSRTPTIFKNIITDLRG